jgi:hypothetical protein
MTGYVKVTSLINETISSNSTGINNNYNNSEGNNNNIIDVDWRARGSEHTSKAPCEGTALNGGIYIEGTVAWKKEIWFTGGYIDARGVNKAINLIADRWIGWKVVMYNIENCFYLDIHAILIFIDKHHIHRSDTKIEER